MHSEHPGKFLLNIGVAIGAVGALLGGRFVDRLGPSAVLRTSLGGCVVGLLLAALPASWTVLVAALCVVGLFAAVANLALPAYLVRLFPNQRRRVLSLALVGSAGLSILYPLIAEGLLKLTSAAGRGGFTLALHGLFAGTAILLLVGTLWQRFDQRGGGAERPTPVAETALLTRSATVLLAALMALHGAADLSASVWMPRVLASASFHRQVLLPGLVSSAYALAYLIARSLLSAAPETRWRRRLMALPGLLGGTIFLGGILTRDQVGTAVGFLAGGCLWALEYPAFLATLSRAGPRFGRAMAAASAAGGVGGFLFSTALGALGDRWGDTELWRMLILPAVAFQLTGLGGLWWVLKHGRSLAPALDHSSANLAIEAGTGPKP